MSKSKNNRQTKIRLGILLTAGLLLAGCGSSSDKSMSMDSAAVNEEAVREEAYGETDLYMENGSDAGGTLEEAGEQAPSVRETERKLIKTVELNAETEEFDELLSRVEEKTESLGGYVEASSLHRGSYYNNTLRSANFTLRIPAERLDEFLEKVAEMSNVTSKNENVTDVTLQYVDMKSHKEALETEQKRLLELLERAETVEDIITIESRLSEVRYQIESMESQLRTMDNQVSYSTVHLYIEEVERLTPAAEQSTWEKVASGFMESLYRVGRGIKNFFIWLIIKLPYLITVAAVILIVLLVGKYIVKVRGKKEIRTKDKAKNGTEETGGKESNE